MIRIELLNENNISEYQMNTEIGLKKSPPMKVKIC